MHTTLIFKSKHTYFNNLSQRTETIIRFSANKSNRTINLSILYPEYSTTENINLRINETNYCSFQKNPEAFINIMKFVKDHYNELWRASCDKLCKTPK